MAERVMRADARRNHERDRGRRPRRVRRARRCDAPLDDIARRAEVGPGTLYRHFPTGEALLAAVYRDDDPGALPPRTRPALAETLPPDEALAAWLRLQLDYITAKTRAGRGGQDHARPSTPRR